MKIKRFHAADVRQAIREVREVLGPDAVILSNTRVDGGVELVAAIDYDENHFKRQAAPNPAQSAPPKIEIDPSPAPATVTPPNPQNIWSQEPTLVQMRKEIAGLRDMLQSQLSDLTWKDIARKSPVQMQLMQRFLKMGIEADLAKQMSQQVHLQADLDHAWRLSLGQLASQLPIMQGDVFTDGGIYAVVGATGVGKTTTIAKLAARFALKHGARQVGLITTDCYRIGGQEQLRNYARIIGVPVRVARSHEEVQDALNELVNRKLILIDTAGMNPRDIQLTQRFALLQGQSPRIKTLLAIAASTQIATLNAIMASYGHLDLSGCILTKTDEAGSLGGALSLLIRQQLPLAFVCDGQQVPEDLRLARPNALINQASQLVSERTHSIETETLEGYGGIAAYG